jgi:hypothetical protein
VLVQLTDGRQLVGLEHHDLVAALAHCLVHCAGVCGGGGGEGRTERAGEWG